MKDQNNFLLFKPERTIGIKNEIKSLIFTESGLSKGYSSKTMTNVRLFLESFVGNLVESFILQRILLIRITDIALTHNVKTRIFSVFERLGYIEEIKKGYSFRNFLDDKVKNYSLTKIKPGPKILNVFDPKSIKPSKSWSIILRIGEKEILEKSLASDHKLLYDCTVKFQKRINVPIKFKRIFNENLNSGGRIYSNYQLMSKESRKLITIDGEETVEIDFPYNHIRILFKVLGIENENDPYVGYGEERKIIKKAFNVLLNSKNPIKVFTSSDSIFRWSKQKAEDFINDVYFKYPKLQKVEGSIIGLNLQKIEGDITLLVMKEALKNDDVVLPVHDSFIVKASKKCYYEDVMNECWNKVVSDYSKSFKI